MARSSMGQDQSRPLSNGNSTTTPSTHLPMLLPAAPESQVPPVPPSSMVVKIEEGHSRPLNPPQHPQDVKRQASQLDEWIALDDEGDIQIATGLKKRKFDDMQDEIVTMDPGITQNAFRPLLVDPEASVTTGSTTSPTGNGFFKKRQAFNAEQRKALMNSAAAADRLSDQPSSLPALPQGSLDEQSPGSLRPVQGTSSSRQTFNMFEDDSATSSDDLADDGTIFDPAEKGASTPLSNTSEEELVKYYARLHQKTMSKSQADLDHPHSPPGKRCSLTGEAVDLILARKQKEETESAERSRQLRERKLGSGSNNSSDSFDVDSLEYDGLQMHTDSATQPPSNTADVVRDFFTGSEKSDNFPDHLDTGNSQLPHESSHFSAQPTEAPRVNGDFDDSILSGNDIDVEALLDVAQNSNLSQPGVAESNDRSNQSPRPANYRTRSQYGLNPYSRSAADKFRTQGRHLDKPYSTVSTGSSQFDLAAGEARLRYFTQMKSPTKPTAQFLHPNCKSSHAQQPIQRQPLLPCPREQDITASRSSSPSPVANRSFTTKPIPRWKRNPSTLQIKAMKDHQKALDEVSTPLSVILAPKTSLLHDTQISEGPLGSANNIDLGDRDAVTKEHERLKHQQRDLEAIMETFKEIAKLQSMDGELHESEQKEVQEARVYATSVIDKELPGRERRARLLAIKSNMRRRIEAGEDKGFNPKEDEFQSIYVDLIGESRLRKAIESIESLQDPLAHLWTRRRALTSKKHNNRKKTSDRKQTVRKPQKQVRWAADLQDEAGFIRRDLPDGTVIDLNESVVPKPKPKKLTKDERNVRSLREALKLFETGGSYKPEGNGTSSDTDNSEAEPADNLMVNDLSFTASRSYSHSGRSRIAHVQQDLEQDEIDRLENERQREEAEGAVRITIDKDTPRPKQSTQTFDHQLVARMQEKTRKAGRVVMTGEGEDSEEVEFADWTDEGSVAASESDESDSDLTDIIQVYKYTVQGQFIGLDKYKDGDEYIFKTFHKFDKAGEHVRELIKDIFLYVSGKYGPRFTLQTQEDVDFLEQMLTIGKNDEIQARIWIHREVVELDLSKQIVSKAKKRKLVDTSMIYKVTWEKTTTTTITQSENIAENEDDLFGPEPTPTPEVIVKKETCPKPVFHRDLAAANRMAKEDYMKWYSQHFPQSERKLSRKTARGTLIYSYSGMLAQVDNAMERDLVRLGDVGLFEAEEEVDVQQEACVGGGRVDEGGEGTEARAAKKEVKEKMKVCVSREYLLGPVN